jgi:hypothetical protein
VPVGPPPHLDQLEAGGPIRGHRRPGRARAAVFVDQSGRRRRLMLVVGGAVGSVLLATLGLLIAGLSGASPVRVPGFPDSGGNVVVDPHQPAAGPQPTTVAPGTGQTGAAVPPAAAGTATEETNRRVPTQTPPHRPKPTKT